MLPFFIATSLFTLAKAAPQAVTSGCVGTISSLDDVSNAVMCTTVNINSFTVPAGEMFSLDLVQGTSVHVLGEIRFANASWTGPMFKIKGQDITFDGHGNTWDGGGSYHWDGRGTHGGDTKPHPLMSIEMSGTFSNVQIMDSPAHCVSVDNVGPIVVSGVTIDNSQGAYANDKSDGRPAGVNTDGFDVCGDDVVIEKSVVRNQDDCLAINRGKNIVFRDNQCDGGHGISIGSISSDTTVENVTIEGNTVLNSVQAFRIKTDRDATGSSVSNIVYSNNIAKNCTEFGVLITQSYPENFDTPGNGVEISNVSFYPGTTEVDVDSDADTIAINCGSGSCTGQWKWSGLQVSGGKLGPITNKPDITGISL